MQASEEMSVLYVQSECLQLSADHLKLMFPMGWTITTIAWSIIDGQELLSSQQYESKSNLQWAIETLEYGLEFLLDCSLDNGDFVFQVCEVIRETYSFSSAYR